MRLNVDGHMGAENAENQRRKAQHLDRDGNLPKKGRIGDYGQKIPWEECTHPSGEDQS